jgi:hypothetical protein
MPAVHEIIATLNQLAQARLPGVGWRGANFDATRFVWGGWMRSASLAPELPEVAEGAYAHAGVEPPLDEVLSDPVIQLIMAADQLRPADVRRLLEGWRRDPATPVDPGAICPQ